MGQVWSTSVLLVQECRVVELLQTQPELGAHCTHLAGLPAHFGVAPVQDVATQLPLAEQVFSVVSFRQLAAAVLGSQPTQLPFRQVVEAGGTLHSVVAKAPALQYRRWVPWQSAGVSALQGLQVP